MKLRSILGWLLLSITLVCSESHSAEIEDQIRALLKDSEALATPSSPLGIAPSLVERPQGVSARVGDRSVILHWEAGARLVDPWYLVFRRETSGGPFAPLTSEPRKPSNFVDLTVENERTYTYVVQAMNDQGERSEPSKPIEVQPRAYENDDAFLDLLQQTAFDYFWREVNPNNGLVRDRNRKDAPASIAATGFGLTAIGIGVDHGWIGRDEAALRVMVALKFLSSAGQSEEPAGATGYKGWFYHFLDMETGERVWRCELSSIDTALLLAGVIYVQQYFDGGSYIESRIRQLAERIIRRVDWTWMRNSEYTLTHGWRPESGFIEHRWVGYNEAMILYILGLGVEEHPLPTASWESWTSGYRWREHFGQSFIEFPPLFGHQYSHCWIDFRSIADAYTRRKETTYFENSRRAVLAQRAYAAANPNDHIGYGDLWGWTACDGPERAGYYGYMARGAPPPRNDDGTIAPTAAGGSIVLAPTDSIPMLRTLYDRYRIDVWCQYGFRDAFNLRARWWASDVIGINQGPILIMIENYRTGRVWEVFMKSEIVKRGLDRAGFLPFNN